jgi:hypothetical protein
MEAAIIRWYSFKCFLSSLGSLGGNQDGLVRDKMASFSFEIGMKSRVLFCIGGSWIDEARELRSAGVSRLSRDEPPWSLSRRSWFLASAWNSSASDIILASSLRPAMARFHDFVLFLKAKPLFPGEEGLEVAGVSEIDLGDGGLFFGRLCCECKADRGAISGAVLACSKGIGRGLGAA